MIVLQLNFCEISANLHSTITGIADGSFGELLGGARYEEGRRNFEQELLEASSSCVVVWI